jgi:tRNA(Leu) C34 or U34 (ribose-2'-O)-methylase TrmL
VERCTNDYNYSAILRTVEALGLQHVWIIEPPPPSYKIIAARKTTSNGEEEEEHGEDDDEDEEETDGEDGEHEDDEPDITQLEDQQEPFRSPGTGKLIKTTSGKERRDRALHHLFARRAMEWLSVREFATTQECLEELRNTHHVVWATDLSQQAVCLTHDALQEYYDTHQQQRQQQQGTNNHHTLSSSSLVPKQLAIVFGTEAVGCSAEMLEAADLRVYLPLRGFADSLNLSVATALVLHQLFCLDPTLIGSMPESERRSLRQAWFAKLCRQRLLTPSQKRQRYKLLHKIKICHDVQHQQQHGHFLHKEQLAKLDRLPALQQELAKLDQRNHLIETAIADLVDHPPAALTDMRRADDHRVCYVGKNTKRRHETDWQDMPATSNIHTLHNSTATFFRQRVRELDLRQPQDQEIH